MYCKNFSELSKGDAAIAGGKGASLGEMTNAEIPVPPGFVVLADAFEKFLAETDLNIEIDSILHSVDMKAMHTVEHASETIQKLILEARMPGVISEEIMKDYKDLCAEPARNTSVSDVGGFVAVRSSATAEDSASAAWAGQLDSFLNTTEATLLENVQRCWASLFTPRAIFYRFEKDLHTTKMSVAVVVQKMVESEVSGIAFSVHPVTEDYNQLIIEAGYGLGEAIVSGQITPDSYVVEKNPRRIIDTNIANQERGIYRSSLPAPLSEGSSLVLEGEGWKGNPNEWQMILYSKRNQQKLSNDQILELSEIIIGIEKHYGFPCDIEWAFEGGKFYIVQSRPITTLASVVSSEAKERVISTYEKIFSRDFCLPLVEAWCQAEGTDPRIWTEKQQPKKPYIIFEKKGDAVNCYMDHAGIDWIKHELFELVSKDPGYVQFAADKFVESIESVSRCWKKDEISDLNELKMYLKSLRSAWVWFEAVWWLMELFHDNEEQIKKLMPARLATEKIGDGSDALIRDSLRVIYPHLDDLADYLLIEEIESENIPSHAELEKRKNGYIYTNARLFVGGDIKDIESEFGIRVNECSLDSLRQKRHVSGKSAHGGLVRGKVRIILSKKQIPSLEEGEVLVAAMTTPDFLPAMHKAAAFVTDEGGITCHAAIVAREISKPCIIGTKIATQVLHDGDLVEVDADNGIVRIIERKTFSPDDYVRMFAGKSFSYLLTDMFLYYYNDLGVLSVQDGMSWISFLPKSVKEKTLREGKNLYSSKILYKRYVSEFNEYIRSSSEYFESILAQEYFSSNEVEEFFKLVSRHWFFYSKTEFFYTDLLDEKSMVISVEDFDKLKLNGRAYLNKMIFEEDGYIKKLLEKIAVQTGVPKIDLLRYSMKEIALLLQEDLKMPEDRLKEREIFFAAREKNIFGTESKELVGVFLSGYREVSNVIHGTIANKGRAKGRARVLIPDYDDFTKIAIDVSNMEEGEILVAETTSPDIILACKKASAIITNQGGMLSHAAIVSRELGIPCIIGTDKDVVLNIKTGDDLMVDADNGIVRIIAGNL